MAFDRLLLSLGEIGDAAFHLVEKEMDLLELAAAPRQRWGGAT
ncbi:hypothetical protein GCM10009416_51580 [Craurococcus roseus]|uniref:Uncharacterized protein n=1 Tax=Craurococcus roseus TaxID=77585 RepID=A0ABN1GCE1_9PROT